MGWNAKGLLLPKGFMQAKHKLSLYFTIAPSIHCAEIEPDLGMWRYVWEQGITIPWFSHHVLSFSPFSPPFSGPSQPDSIQAESCKRSPHCRRDRSIPSFPQSRALGPWKAYMKGYQRWASPYFRWFTSLPLRNILRLRLIWAYANHIYGTVYWGFICLYVRIIYILTL